MKRVVQTPAKHSAGWKPGSCPCVFYTRQTLLEQPYRLAERNLRGLTKNCFVPQQHLLRQRRRKRPAGQSARRARKRSELLSWNRCCGLSPPFDPWPMDQEFAAGRTFHLAGPPLEPLGGRLHNLLRIARMNRNLQERLSRLQLKSCCGACCASCPGTRFKKRCAPRQRRRSPSKRIPHN